MSARLFVGNLPFDVTDAELREIFSAVGPLSYVYLPTDRESGKPRGFAFVELSDPAKAQEAIQRFNGQMFKGRSLAVNEARAREEGSRSSAPSRPSVPRSRIPSGPGMVGPPGDKPSRDFGPDAVPRRKKKGKSGPKGERVPKGPMREVVRGQFFGGDEDDLLDDELAGENLASRVIDDESEEAE